MRIIGGTLKGRVIKAPPGHHSRPTADRVRESIFNVLAHAAWVPDLAGARVMDVFAGSGALGLEALSRGAEFCLFVETRAAARRTIADNASALGLGDRFSLARHGASNLPSAGTMAGSRPAVFDLAFLDPPYHQGLAIPALASLIEGRWLAAGAVIVLELAATEPFAVPAALVTADDRRWGPARVLFLQAGREGAQAF